jgi:hypothetical protein
MKDVSPFPVPKVFECPYCGAHAIQSKFDPRTGVAFFTHHVEETKKVGQVTKVILHSIHLFAVTWGGGEFGWEHSPGTRLRSSKVCERVEITRGQCSDWASCDRRDQ